MRMRPPDLSALADVISAGREEVTLVVADDGYREVVLNWLVAARSAGRADAVVCTLDDALHRHLESLGIPSARLPWDGSLPGLWETRTRLVRELLVRGTAVTHSDADAVWLRDPAPHIAAHPQADLIASQGTVWPVDALRTLGFVVCCGFFHLRATARSVQLLDEVLQVMAHDPGRDDQAALNRVLAARRAQWLLPPVEAELAVGGTPFWTYQDTVVGQAADGLMTAVLPHTSFQRLPAGGSPVVVHHLAPKDGLSKRAQLQASGAYVLPDGWSEACRPVVAGGW